MSNYNIDITLYEHINQGGETYIAQGNDFKFERNLHQHNWGDRISSIKILNGYLMAFEHIDFGGSCLSRGPNTVLSSLPEGWNDTISSYIASENFMSIQEAINKARLEM